MDVPQPVDDLQLQAVLDQTLRIVLGQARGLQSLQLEGQVEDRAVSWMVCSNRCSSAAVSCEGVMSASLRARTSGARSRPIAVLMVSISPVAATSRTYSAASVSLNSLRPMCVR